MYNKHVYDFVTAFPKMIYTEKLICVTRTSANITDPIITKRTFVWEVSWSLNGLAHLSRSHSYVNLLLF